MRAVVSGELVHDLASARGHEWSATCVHVESGCHKAP